MRDKDAVYYIVEDVINGRQEYETPEEAALAFQRPIMDAQERTVTKCIVLRKKIRITSEQEL